MGSKTAETLEVSTEAATEVIEPTDAEKQLNGGEVPEDDGEPKEVLDVEVVLEGDDGSQPDAQHGIRKRINKLNTKVAQATDTATDAEERLVLSEEKNKLLTLALEQTKAPAAAAPPDPADYDDGAKDPKYVKALNSFTQPMIAAEVQKQTANLRPAQTEAVDPSLVKMQTKHYERALALGAKDFDAVEDKAIEILGQDTVNHLINSSDESHLVLYYLGKNPEKAVEIKQLIDINPVKATLQLGQLSAKLSVKPRANNEPTPDPDEELQGGSPAAGKTNKHQQNVDDAREKARETRNMKPLIDAKKAAKEAGVTVI